MEAIGGLTAADEDCGPFCRLVAGQRLGMLGYPWKGFPWVAQATALSAVTARGANASEGLF
jgi:hypothetical protein